VSKGISELIGIVPAAGAGSRLSPYPNAKELFPIGYQRVRVNDRIERRPKVISQYLIENMINGGVRRFFFILGEGKHDIMHYYGNGSSYDVDVAYLFQEQLHGMPFAIDLVYPWLRGDETVVMGMPDTLIEPGDAFAKLLSAHRRWNADLTLGLFRTDKPAKFGMIGIDDESNVIEHVDKPSQTDLRWLWGIAAGEWSSRILCIRGSQNSETIGMRSSWARSSISLWPMAFE